MRRHVERWVVVGLVVLGLVTGTRAQDRGSATGSRPNPRSSLADRLGHLGRKVVGAEEPAAAVPAASASGRAGTHSRRPGPMPQAAPSQAPPRHAADSEAIGSPDSVAARRPASRPTPSAGSRSSRRTAQSDYAREETDSPDATEETVDSAAEAATETADETADEPTAPITTSRRPLASAPPTSSRRGHAAERSTAAGRRPGNFRPPLAAPADETADAAADESEESPETADETASDSAETEEATEPAAEQSTELPAGDEPIARTARVSEPRALRSAETSPAAEAEPGSDDDLLVTQQSPAILISTAGPRRIKVGSPAKFVVQLQNAGSAPANDLVVTVRLPDWAELVALDATSGDARRPGQGEVTDAVEWSFNQLDSAAQAELTLELIPRKSRPLDLNVQWTHAPVASLAQVEVQEAKLQMAISGPEEVQFGDREMYKLTLSNPGTGDAENVVVRLLPTSPGDTESATHRIGTIAAGHTKVVELELTARDPGQLVISAEAVAEGGLRAAATAEVLVRRADLAAELVGPRKQFAGSVASYKVSLTNPGNAAARNIVVSAIAPPGGKFLAASEGGRIESEGAKIVWRLATLRPGVEQPLAFRCQLETPGPNRPQLVCQADDDLKATAAITTEVEAMADLVLTVRDPSGPVPVGEDAEYEIRVLNRGKKAAEGVEFAAFFSDGVEPLDAAGARYQLGAGQVIFEQLPLVEAGQEVVLTVRARAQRGGDHIFRAQVRCQSLNTTLAGEETTHFYEVSFDESAASDAATQESDSRATVESAGVESYADPSAALEESAEESTEDSAGPRDSSGTDGEIPAEPFDAGADSGR